MGIYRPFCQIQFAKRTFLRKMHKKTGRRRGDRLIDVRELQGKYQCFTSVLQLLSI